MDIDRIENVKYDNNNNNIDDDDVGRSEWLFYLYVCVRGVAR